MSTNIKEVYVYPVYFLSNLRDSAPSSHFAFSLLPNLPPTDFMEPPWFSPFDCNI